MKYVGVGLCVLLVVVAGRYFDGYISNELDAALEESQDSVRSASTVAGLTGELGVLELIATSPVDGTAVVKQEGYGLSVVREDAIYAGGTFKIEKVADQSIMLRSLKDNSLSVVFVNGQSKQGFQVITYDDIDVELSQTHQ